MLAVTGGTVADVYSGTWVEANVEIDGGRIVYVGPREPPARRRDHRRRAGRSSRRATSSRTRTRGACTRRPSLLEVGGARRDDDARLRQPLLLPGARRRRAAPDRRRDARTRPRTSAGWRGSRRSRRYPDEARALRDLEDRAAARLAEVVASGRDHELDVGRARRAAGGGGIAAAKAARKRVEGHNAGASYNRLNELSAAGISADHEAITGEEALARLRLGMWTMLRQSSLRPDLERDAARPAAGDRLARAG